jgi:hypothetical protein
MGDFIMSSSTIAVNSETLVAERVNLRSLLWVGPAIIVASLVVNAVIRALTQALFSIPDYFTPISSPSFIGLTVALVIAALVVFVIVARFSKRPYRTYLIIAIIALLISYIPDVMFLLGGYPLPNGEIATVPAVGPLSLMLMHTATAAITVGALFRFTRPP